ncbi:hypothetical protein ALC60_03094 [Trachymyrmex zeteki]|uniref:Uncharacterized protein n=1 Tax=Mycetomoellerius zeteki TaxID=64791 RepID=A0A151XCE9_9HYME|nr:hypothetical protein ALC60_03094 [Trachymyrmex zeteki]
MDRFDQLSVHHSWADVIGEILPRTTGITCEPCLVNRTPTKVCVKSSNDMLRLHSISKVKEKGLPKPCQVRIGLLIKVPLRKPERIKCPDIFPTNVANVTQIFEYAIHRYLSRKLGQCRIPLKPPFNMACLTSTSLTT